MNYLPKSKKSEPVKKLISQAIEIMVAVGIPIENKSERALEKMAMAFLAVGGINKDWKQAKGLDEKRFLKTRDIIQFNNTHFEETISSGSYDDIRRKDLKLLVLADLIIRSAENPNAATNDPTRGYSLAPDFAKLVKTYGTKAWKSHLTFYLENKTQLKELLSRKRVIEKISILLPNGKQIEFSAGKHNLLQKQIIEEFLPRYGKGCQILYVGDSADKFLYMEKATLEKLRFFELSHEELPDVIAYNPDKNWLYLIEAVHSSGSISEVRMLELKKLTNECTAELIYVTAFLTKKEFRKWATEIAWETEVWIAENPDHLIHFDGDKFLGPYQMQPGLVHFTQKTKATQSTEKAPASPNEIETKEPLNFLEEIIERDIAEGKHGGRVHTRFPPEPNGYLHIGHATSINLNFGLAEKFNGQCNLRFDDTNPVTEETEYVESIIEDVRWLGFEPDAILYASDYFGQLYGYAVKLIEKGLAYVDDTTPDEIAALKGTPTEPGRPSPYRERSVEENLRLFEGMKNGEFEEGSRVLRAKIDMASPNMIMRDPVLYRIKFAHHHRTGDVWCIYPMYDMAHGQCDSIERITHSICTLEFAPHRELYDWLIEKLEIFPSKQYEFARRNFSYTVVSKRKLLKLVQEGYVSGWNDPRMPTISAMRRRGFTPWALREFSRRIGIAKRENMVDVGLLEFCVREDLNKTAKRVMAVLNPLKVVLTNYPEGETEWLETENNPEDPEAGKRQLPFSRELYIEQEDFMENPPKKFFRLSPGGLVRLKSAYIIRCDEVVKDTEGNITELRCTYFPESKSGQDTSGLKPATTLHWVSANHAIPAEVRLYDRLFSVEDVANDPRDFHELLNPDSLKVQTAWLEPGLADAKPGESYQFIRLGYFTPDIDSVPGKPVFNRTVTLRDAWAKTVGKS